MQSIEIKNFGPVVDCKIDIKDFMLFIGRQASGKSTICKCIYFFKSLRDDLLIKLSYLVNMGDNGEFITVNQILNHYVLLTFPKFFQTEKREGMSLKFVYKDSFYVEMKESTISPFYPDISFSPEFEEEINKLERKVTEFRKRLAKVKENDDAVRLEVESDAIYKDLKSIIYNIFDDDRELVFIPAGRSLISVLSDQLGNISRNNVDYITGKFLKIINDKKPDFRKNIDEIILEQKSMGKLTNLDLVDIAKELLSNILYGEYINDTDGEKIFIKGQRDKYVRINYASSGQHEAVWILNLIFNWILKQKKMFVVIEEPEAHLFPEAQNDIVNLIALFANSNKNQVLITTHSPYILTSVNNLIYAHKVGKKKSTEVDKIIKKELWLDIDKCSAFMVGESEDEYIRSIIDPELKEIAAEEIDKISKKINKDYSKIYNLEVEDEHLVFIKCVNKIIGDYSKDRTNDTQLLVNNKYPLEI